MKISRENYELFFIDYLDGNLSDHQIAELENFLLLNSDLRAELEGMENVKLLPEGSVFTDKDILRKIDTSSPISEENINDYCVAYIEGDLDIEKTTSLNAYIASHPEYEKEIELYRKTVLTPDFSINLKDKRSLKKEYPLAKRIYIYSALSTAAAIALLMIIFWKTDTLHFIPDQLTEKIESPEIDPYKTETTLQSDASTENLLTESTANFHKKEEKTEIIRKVTATDHLAMQTSREEYHLAENRTPEEISLTGITLASLNLPVIDFEGARPDVIKRLAVQKESAVLSASPAEPDYLSLPDIALKYVNDKVLKREEPADDPSRITLWEIADAGIKGINRITGSEMKLEKQTGDSGETKMISFDAGFFGFSRPVR